MNCQTAATLVAPPRGERGLKRLSPAPHALPDTVAPPRGERGLKLGLRQEVGKKVCVAPPRGERGLKRYSLP